jgi:hypothetical protein
MTNQTATNLPAEVAAMFAKDDRIAVVRVYHDGFVANAYKWAAPGNATEYTKDGASTKVAYDRKRSHGRGPGMTGLSIKRGVLASI